VIKYISLFFGTGFGIGYIRYAPGTFGSLLAMLLFVIFYHPLAGDESLWQSYYLGIVIALLVFGTIVSWAAEYSLNKDDPKEIVIDEILGMAVTFLFLPKTYLVVILGFALFRLLDIIKPFPAYQSQRVPFGLGIMLDDLIAGIYSNLLIRLILGSRLYSGIKIPDLF